MIAIEVGLSASHARRLIQKIQRKRDTATLEKALDDSILRTREIGQKALAEGSIAGLNAALRAEMAAAQLLTQRLGLASPTATGVHVEHRELTDEELADRLNIVADAARLLAAEKADALAIIHEATEVVPVAEPAPSATLARRDVLEAKPAPATVTETVTQRETAIVKETIVERRFDSAGRELDENGFSSDAQRRLYESVRGGRRYYD